MELLKQDKMREILFRGKRDNGAWIEGSLLLPTTDRKETQIVAWNGTRFNVIPETVGQYTGLTDKDGIKIFEGDIIKVPDDWDEYRFMAGEVRTVYFATGGFRLRPREGVASGHYIEDDGVFEIIGNTHDKI